jgi:hypothetical protein
MVDGSQSVSWVFKPSVDLNNTLWIWAGDNPAEADKGQYQTKPEAPGVDPRPVVAEVLFKLAVAVHRNQSQIQVCVEKDGDNTYIVADPQFSFPNVGAVTEAVAAAGPSAPQAKGSKRTGKRSGRSKSSGSP